MKAKSQTIAVLLIVVMGIAVAGCGSSGTSSKSPSSSSTTQSGTAASSPKGAAFTVGSICSCSGAQAAAFGSLQKVSSAWADSVNAAGGINGHPVKMIALDDGGNPSQALLDAKELVQSDHVMAIVGDDSLVDETWASYVASKGVPVVGGLSLEAPFLTNPDFFSSGASIPITTLGTLALAKQAGAKKVGVLYCSESPVCKEVVPLGQALAGVVGLGFASQSVSSTAPSYAAPCLALKGQGVDALVIGDNGATVQRIVDSCAQEGYKPLQATNTTTEVPSWLSDSNFNGTLLASIDAPYTDTSIPGVAAFTAAINKYAPGLSGSSQFTYDTFLPWVAGELFVAAAKAGKLTPTSTPADVKKGLYALKDETLGGMTPPLTFTPGKPSSSACYFSVKVQSGKFVSLNGGKDTCISAGQAAAVSKAIG